LPVPLLLQLTMNFTLENGSTPHLVALGDNRIGTVHSSIVRRRKVIFCNERRVYVIPPFR